MSAKQTAADARKMLAESGEHVTITTTQSGSEYDPLTGEFSAPATTSFAAYGYLGSYSNSEVDGTNILSTDGRLIMPATSPRIAVGWTALVDSAIYRIISVKPTRENGIDVLQILQVRL